MLYWQRFNLFTLYFFAISVSLGAALVSISKALVFVSFICYLLFMKPWQNKNIYGLIPFSILIICVAMTWMCLTAIWSDVSSKEIEVSLFRHSRLLLIPIVFLLISSKEVCQKVLTCLMLSHVVVVCLSFLMYSGIHIPFTQTKQPFDYAVPFTSSLEQPVMSTLVVVLLWYFKDVWEINWKRYLCNISIVFCVVNVFFVMLGRTGFILMLLTSGLIGFLDLPKRYKLFAFITPLILGFILFNFSPRLHDKTIQINDGLSKYEAGDYNTSEGQRLDYWKRSYLSIQASPIIGTGIGSWRNEYQRLGGLQPNPPSNPHNQFLLWWVEAGIIGLLFMLSIFISLYRDLRMLDQKESRALICITSLAVVMSLFNCPFYGIGMGEFFMILFGTLLATGKYSRANTQLIASRVH